MTPTVLPTRAKTMRSMYVIFFFARSWRARDYLPRHDGASRARRQSTARATSITRSRRAIDIAYVSYDPCVVVASAFEDAVAAHRGRDCDARVIIARARLAGGPSGVESGVGSSPRDVSRDVAEVERARANDGIGFVSSYARASGTRDARGGVGTGAQRGV